MNRPPSCKRCTCSGPARASPTLPWLPAGARSRSPCGCRGVQGGDRAHRRRHGVSAVLLPAAKPGPTPARSRWYHRWAALRKRVALDQHRLGIGGVAFPRKLESLHLLITGATGAGKSQTIQGTLDAIRGRGDAAILTDIGSEALRGFGQTGDRILNPLDGRSVPWSPFAEMRAPPMPSGWPRA